MTKKMRNRKQKRNNNRPVQVQVPTNTYRLNECKKFDTYVAGTIDYNGQLTLIDLPVQGTGSTQRIGNQITIRQLEIAGTISTQGAGTFDTVRIILIIDNMGVNAPAISEILDGSVLGSSSAVVAMRNHGYVPRFKIIYDKLHTVSTGGGQQVTWKVNLRPNLVSYFVGAATFKNQIYHLAISNEGNLLTAPLIYTGIRVHFTDD